jgi:7-carboxy-7-deazaguanine synthase
VKISEIFYSVQGEGTLAGVPSVFVRTSGCNLRCVWCDTPYTSWSPEGEFIAVADIAARVHEFRALHVVITGGEPMMFAETVELAALFRAAGLHITIETAGTLWQDLECDLMSISPKLANSTPFEREGGRWAAQHDRLRYQPDILRRLMDRYDYQLKFVVASEADLPELERMCEETRADRAKVILMPEGVTPEVLRGRGRWLAEVCKSHGYRYSPRLHVDLWGDERGR